MKYFLFGEGKTEDVVMRKLIRACFPEDSLARSIIVTEAGGRENQFKAIEITVGPQLIKGLGCIVLVDRDRENTDGYDVVRSTQQRWTRWLQKFLDTEGIEATVSFEKHPQYDTILLYQTPPALPNVRFVLHIAESPPIPDLHGYPFHNAATDDYILALALTEGVLNRFAHKAHIDAHIIRNKTTHEIPELLEKNGFRELVAKDAIAMYMTATRFLKIKRTMVEAEATFAGVVIDRAEQFARAEFEQVFASHIAAIKLLTQEE